MATEYPGLALSYRLVLLRYLKPASAGRCLDLSVLNEDTSLSALTATKIASILRHTSSDPLLYLLTQCLDQLARSILRQDVLELGTIILHQAYVFYHDIVNLPLSVL